MPLKGKSWNRIVLTIFAPLLILVGALGFVLPEEASLTSGAPAYNIFHLIFGAVGMACVWSGKTGGEIYADPGSLDPGGPVKAASRRSFSSFDKS